MPYSPILVTASFGLVISRVWSAMRVLACLHAVMVFGGAMVLVEDSMHVLVER